MADQRYLYEVHPQKAIVFPGQRPIRRPFSNLLTRDEVLEYMGSGRVYRKFSATDMELVTGENINKLHRSSKEVVETKKKSEKNSLFKNLNKEPNRGSVSISTAPKPDKEPEEKFESEFEPVEDKKETEDKDNTTSSDTEFAGYEKTDVEEIPAENDKPQVSTQTRNRGNNKKHNGGRKNK